MLLSLLRARAGDRSSVRRGWWVGRRAPEPRRASRTAARALGGGIVGGARRPTDVAVRVVWFWVCGRGEGARLLRRVATGEWA